MVELAETFPEETEGLKEALMNNDPATAVQILKYLMKQDNIPLNIGITGGSGSGKSSFVNAFRGLSNKDEGAAPTGCVETTSVVTPYPHPNYPNVILWDLPDVGTTRFPADKYQEMAGFQKFDFFFIISDTRFRENDVKLALEIQRMGKKFYFVRTKIDNDMRAEERKLKDHFNAGTSLTKVRQDCIQGLQSQGFESPQVFLVSCFERHMYDFSLLHETFNEDLPALRKHALRFAVVDINQEIINKKKKAFLAEIKYYAAISAAGAAVPVPGLYVAVDTGLMVTVIRRYTAGFGLDVSPLERLAANMEVTFQDVKAVIRPPLTSTEMIKNVVLKVLVHLTVIAEKKMSSYFPIYGAVAAMSLSSFTTYKALNSVLDMLAGDAQRVFKRALGL
ncbi:interferon-inducible GTPase 5-like [Melanotaenia boesemani]|uniref:interferon-inducible GTPase 5-like n=1 Tax=Melanotaenia boesemani TaxID=1250792 RepID=UPI001C0501DF|nr:interferon-inducible GTPase 5-like [Melanotaenia boesemani]